jgi:hypothetical protein
MPTYTLDDDMLPTQHTEIIQKQRLKNIVVENDVNISGDY